MSRTAVIYYTLDRLPCTLWSKKMHKIPLQVLLASCLCVARKDFRQYLEFVKIQDGYVSSTDGHRLFVCDVDGLDKTLDLFIR